MTNVRQIHGGGRRRRRQTDAENAENSSDDEGRLRAASRMLASLLYPIDWVDEWERAKIGCIRRYVPPQNTRPHRLPPSPARSRRIPPSHHEPRRIPPSPADPRS